MPKQIIVSLLNKAAIITIIIRHRRLHPIELGDDC